MAGATRPRQMQRGRSTDLPAELRHPHRARISRNSGGTCLRAWPRIHRRRGDHHKVSRGVMRFGSMPAKVSRTLKPKTGSTRIGWFLRSPQSAASSKSARHFDRHARTDAIGAAGPTGIEEPAVDLCSAISCAAGWHRHWMARHERRAEAGRECRLAAHYPGRSRCPRPWPCSRRGNDTSPGSA